ncbi:MAG: DUF3857 domain-containing protein, partial [Chthoniobacterales bacterium]
GEQKIFLLLARTILPDGRQLEVQPNAALIKSPQRDANDSLYSDEDELVLIFPNISAGAITESIIVTEEQKGRIPGEFSRNLYWRSWWPGVMKRRIIDLPADYASRLHVIDLGSGVPQPTRETDKDGRTRLTWQQEKQAATHWESNVAPVDQTGPATEVTTLPDWDAFAAWYGRLLSERSKLNPKLAAEVAALTKNAKSPREVIDILTRKVSRDVRYTGLEFGLAGFQPADCNDVWANGYGDCKDKANLLRAMFEAGGLRAYLALVNTEHEGKVDRRSPSYLPFNHAIVAVEEKPGELLFCDPTIQYGRAGVITPASGDRDVFLVNEKGSKWARTPVAEGGAISFRFDLTLNEQGEISGWMTWKGEGGYASNYFQRFAELDRDNLVSDVRGTLRNFFPAAEVIDVKPPAAMKGAEPFELRAFFIASVGNASQEKFAVQFPISDDMLPDAVTDKPRKTDFFMWRDVVEVSMHLALPAGIQALDPPAPYALKSRALSAKGSWKVSPGAADASVTIRTTASVVPPGDFAALSSAVRSLQSWLGQPLLVGRAAGAPANQAAKTTSDPDDSSLDGFPMLATAEGQRDLLDRRFPSENGVGARKRALQRLVQYFPNDPASAFYSGMELASIQYDDGDHAGAVAKMESLIAAYRGKIEARWVAWGEYNLAWIYAVEKHREKALSIFSRLAADKSLFDYRRAWSGYQAAALLRESKPAEAIRILNDTIVLDSSALPDQVRLLTGLLIKGGDIAKLPALYEGLAARKPEFTDAAVAASVEVVPPTDLETVSAMIEKSGVDIGEKAAEALAGARKGQRSAKLSATLAIELTSFLKQHPPSQKSKAATPGALQKEIDAAIDKSEPSLALDLTLQRLTEFPPDADFSMLLWKASARAEWVEKLKGAGAAGPVFSFLLGLCDRLPHDDENYYEAKFVLGRRLERTGDFTGAEAVFAGILADPQFPDDFTNSAIRDRGRMLEKQGRYADALKNYLTLKSRIGDSETISDLMLRAVLLDLHLGKTDDALDLLQRLDKVSPEKANEAAGARQIAALVALARNPDMARKYWQATGAWQAPWSALLARISPSGVAPEPVAVPLTSDLSEPGQNLLKSQQSRNKSAAVGTLNLLASAARWEPALAVELAVEAPPTIGFFLQRADACNEEMLLVVQPVPDTDADLSRRREVVRAALLLDAGRPAASLEVISSFMKNDHQQDEVHFGMARVWGVASYSLKEQRNPAVAELEKILALDDAVSDRGNTVSVLARLYELQGRPDAERALLKRETENPQVKNSPQIDDLLARARKLEDNGMSAEDFSKFLAGWVKEFRPGWYDLAAPASLSDPLVKDMTDDGASLAPQEFLKWKLLVAADPSKELSVRVDAWKGASMGLFDLIASQKKADHFFQAIIGSPLLDKELRAFWLYLAMYDAGTRMERGRFELYGKDPLVRDFNDHGRRVVLSLAPALGTNRKSIASIEKNFRLLGRKPMGSGELQQLQWLFISALMLGDTDAAQRMYDQFQKFSLTADNASHKPAVSLSMLRQLKAAQRWKLMHAALRAEILRRFPAAELTAPASFDDVRKTDDQSMIDQADAQRIRLHRLAASQVVPGDTNFWSDLTLGFETGRADSSLRLKLVEILLKTQQSDADKAEAAPLALDMIDLDNPAERQVLLNAASIYRDSKKWPLTSKALHKMDIRIAMRTGEHLDINDVLMSLPSEGFDPTWVRIADMIQKRDVAGLKDSLGAMSSDQLLNPRFVVSAITALDMAGLSDEATLARQTAREELKRAIFDSWLRPDGASIGRTLRLARVLGDPDGLPKQWIAFMNETIQDPLTRLKIELDAARLQKDWERVRVLAEQGTKSFPTFYFLYRYLGEALYHLGRGQDALAPLEKYTSYSKDEIEFAMAMDLINAIKQEKEPAPAQ